MGDELGRLLLACLREATAATPSAVSLGWLGTPAGHERLRHLVAAAEHHGIAPAVHSVLGGSPQLSDEARSALERAYQHQWQVHLRALADLAELARLLDGLGRPWAVVKGPVLAETVYRRFDVRSYLDLDLIVHRTAIPAVLDALEAAGAQLSDRNWTMIRAQRRGELALVLAHGTILDLHWHLFNEPRVRRAFSVSMGDLLARARRVEVHGTPVATLDPSDTLVYVAAHAGLAGGHRLVWLKDIEQLVARQEPEWDEVVRRARASGLGLVTATVLGRARRVTGAEVPSAVLDDLAPAAGWRAVVALAERISPPQRSFTHRLTGRTLVASTRRSGLASAVELATATWGKALKPLFSDPHHPWRRRLAGPGLTEPVPNALRQPVGGDTDRPAFLRLLAESPVEP